MKVCVLTTSYPRFDGDEAGIFVGRLVEALSGQGAEGFAFVPLDKDEKREEQAGNFIVKRFKYGVFSRGRLAFGSGIVPQIKANPLLIFQVPSLVIRLIFSALSCCGCCDVIHANWIGAGCAAWIASVLSGQPYVITVRGEDVRLLQKGYLYLLFWLVLKKAKAVTSVNSSFLDILKKKYGLKEDRLFCIPNGVTSSLPEAEEYSEFLKEKGFDPNRKYLFFAGTVIPRKRIEILIELMTNSYMKDYSLVLCGRLTDSAYVEKLREQAGECGGLDRILFQGPASPREIPFYLKLCRYYISASEFEGRPNSVLEALAAERIVLLSDIEAHRELIEDKQTGILFDPENLDSLVDSIRELENSSKMKDAIVKNSQTLISEYSWEKTAEKYLAVFKG